MAIAQLHAELSPTGAGSRRGKAPRQQGIHALRRRRDRARHLRQRTTFEYVSGFQGLKVRSFSHSATLRAGAWTVVVMNSENILNTMVVRLRVVVDPGP